MEARREDVLDELRRADATAEELAAVGRDSSLIRAFGALFAHECEIEREAFAAAAGSCDEEIRAIAALRLAAIARTATAAAAAFDAICVRFGDSENIGVLTQVGRAMLARARELPDDADSSYRACDDVLRRFGNRGEPALQMLAARALLHQARLLRAKGDERAAAVFDAIADRWSGQTDALVRGVVLEALNDRTLANDTPEEAKLVSDRAVTLLPPVVTGPLRMRFQAARTLMIRANLMYDIEESAKPSAELWAEVVRRFADDPAPSVKGVVRQAREADQIAGHEHRRGGPYGLRWYSPFVVVRIPFHGKRRLWGWRAWLISLAPAVLVLALMAWPLSRRFLEVWKEAADAREKVLAEASTAVWSVGLLAMAVMWISTTLRLILAGERPQARSVIASVAFGAAAAVFVLLGGTITGLFE